MVFFLEPYPSHSDEARGLVSWRRGQFERSRRVRYPFVAFEGHGCAVRSLERKLMQEGGEDDEELHRGQVSTQTDASTCRINSKEFEIFVMSLIHGRCHR